MIAEERKRAAQALNHNPLLEEIFKVAEQKCFATWLADPNREERDQVWNRVKAIQQLRNDINAAVKSALRDEQQQSLD